MKKASFLAVLIFGMVGVPGCGDEYVDVDVPIIDIRIDSINPVDNGGDNDTGERDTVDDDGTVTCVSGFDFDGEPEDPEAGADIKMSTTQTRPIPVYYRDCVGNDGDRLVTFAQIDGEEYCELLTTAAYTDDTGLALGSIKSLERSGFCHVKACAEGLPEDQCVTITILVDPKSMSPLRVKFDTYTGKYPKLYQGTVRIYKKTTENQYPCSAMDPRNLPPRATVEKNEIAIINGIAIFPSLPDLEKELTQDYTVVGMGFEKNSTVMRAWACDDTNGHVEWGDMTVVTLKMYDLVPQIVGSWDMHSEFDLISGLPDPVEKVINILIGLFESPTAQILAIMCDEKLVGINIGGDLCGYIFADPENPDIHNLATIGTFVVSLMDQIIINLLENNCPLDNPKDCGKIYFTGRDVGVLLQRFRIDSTMDCINEPAIDWSDPGAGAVIQTGDCLETWHTIWFRWTYGKDCEPTDPDCGYDSFNLGGIPGMEKTITADISGRITDGEYLHIDPHTVNLRYGALINFLLEKILLPQVFGPAVNSYENLIGSLLAGQQCLATFSCCSDFDATLVAKYSWLPAGIAESACVALIDAGVSYIRTTLDSLDSDVPNFTLATPPDNPAHIIDNDLDMYFDTIGTKMEQCSWQANLAIGSWNYDPTGIFWGIRY